MSRNEVLLKKADMVLSDLSAGGLLQPEQADTFIRKLIKQPTILRECRVVTMKSPQRKINRIGFAGRIMRAAISATALTQSQRAKPTTDEILLSAQEAIAEIRLPYDVVEDSIEHAQTANNEANNTGPGGLRDTVINLIADYAARDIEDLAVNGDTAFVSGDANEQAYMRLQDGFLKIGQNFGNVVDVAGDTVSKNMFKKGIFGMPVQYLRNRAAMKNFVSVYNEAEYQDTLANRGTPMGDSRLMTNTPAMSFGTPVAPVPLMPDTKGIFCDPMNLIVGFWRQVSMEFDKDISARVYIIVLTTRIAVQVEQADAMVVYNNVAAPF
jgi:hypothetical protein